MKRLPLLPKPRASKEALHEVAQKQSTLVGKLKTLEKRIKALETKQKAQGSIADSLTQVERLMPGVTTAGDPDLVQDSLKAIWQELEYIHQRLDSLRQVEGGPQHD